MTYLSYIGNFSSLIGKTIKSISKSDDGLAFKTEDGWSYTIEHHQDCCETVYLDEVHGDIEDLVGEPLLLAEESQEAGEGSDYMSQTWSFYKLATVKGYVTLKFFGESNGYYSETADLYGTAPESP